MDQHRGHRLDQALRCWTAMSDIDHAHIQEAVLRNVELAAEALNRELHLAEIVRLNLAVHADNTIGQPIRVTVVKLNAKEPS